SPAVAQARPVNTTPVPEPAKPRVETQAAAPTRPVSAPAPQEPAKPRVELQASTPPRPANQPSPDQQKQAFHVGAGLQIPETSRSVAASEPPAKPVSATPVSALQVTPIVPPVMGASISPDLLRARELAKQSAQWRQDNGEVPTLDTTQTIRTLTKKEL